MVLAENAFWRCLVSTLRDLPELLDSSYRFPRRTGISPLLPQPVSVTSAARRHGKLLPATILAVGVPLGFQWFLLVSKKEADPVLFEFSSCLKNGCGNGKPNFLRCEIAALPSHVYIPDLTFSVTKVSLILHLCFTTE